MTATAALYWLLTLVAGGLVAALVRTPLRIEERVALSVVAGVLLGTLSALGWTTVAGMGTWTVLAGPLLVAVVAAIGLVVVGGEDWAVGWRESWAETRERWDSHELMWVAGVAVAAVIGFSILFGHALFPQDGNIDSNFVTVWADWSMHATTASSFAVGHNLPPANPVYSGTTLLYPFLPDFQSGMLLTLGVGIGPALAVPSALMCVAISLLVLGLARRLTGSVIAGALAMAMCLLGGGLGVEALYWDACTAAHTASSQCDPGRFLHDPVGAVGTAVNTVAHAPGVIAAQPRAYDALETPTEQQPLSNIQWYTPLLAWWLPQRPFLFGFAAALCVFLIVVSTRGDPRPQWPAFAIAGLLWGLLPLVHVHSFIAVLLVMPVFALLWRRREWWAMVLPAVVIGTPRLVQLAHGDHGAVALGNDFPWLEPGWLSQAIPTAQAGHAGVHLASVVSSIGDGLRLLVTPQWWGFWVVNCGIVLPVMALLGVAVLGRLVPRDTGVRRVADRVAGAVPVDLLRFCLPFLVIFVVCNLVVFQSWDWDNTKLFAYWYFGAVLLLAGLVVALWRRRWWWRTLGTVGFVSVIMTGAVVMLRFLPWTPASLSNAGAIVWESADDRSLAAQVLQRTPADAVILTMGRHNDPLMTLAGRRTVVGYTGWLWSYGIDYRARQADVGAMYLGCPSGSRQCAATDLMHHYAVSYVEISPSEYERNYPQGNLQWWAQSFPVVAQAGGVSVYDVRSVG